MGPTLTATEAQPIFMYRMRKGQIERFETKQDEYITVPQGYYRLRLVGVSDTFERPDNFNPGRMKTKVRMEWLVVAAHTPAGRQAVNGRFTDTVNFVLSDRSSMGKIAAALTGNPIAAGETVEVFDWLRSKLELEGSITNTTKANQSGVNVTYTNLAYDTLAAVGTDDEEEDETPEPPAKKAKAAPVKNPILDEDEEEE